MDEEEDLEEDEEEDEECPHGMHAYPATGCCRRRPIEVV
jgi:hypothetical protein